MQTVETPHSVDGMKSGTTLHAEWNSTALRIVLPER